MAPATKTWPDHYLKRDLQPEEAIGSEVLCERCFNLRQLPLKKRACLSFFRAVAQGGREMLVNP
jgi:hypothetical protein